MSRQSRMVDTLAQYTEILVRCDNELPAALAVIDATAAYHLGAQSYDGPRVSGRGTEQHEDEDGVVRSSPIRPDPVGSHVVNADESTQADLDELEPWIRAVANAVTGLEAVLWRHQGAVHRAVTPRERLAREASDRAVASASVERENECCESCRRGYAREPQGSDPGQRYIVTELFARSSDVKGRLDRRMRLCEWCWRYIDEVGALPTIDELHDHHAGRKVRRRVAP